MGLSVGVRRLVPAGAICLLLAGGRAAAAPEPPTAAPEYGEQVPMGRPEHGEGRAVLTASGPGSSRAQRHGSQEVVTLTPTRNTIILGKRFNAANNSNRSRWAVAVSEQRRTTLRDHGGIG